MQTVGRVVGAEGVRRGPYYLLTVLLWFGGEFVGALAGAVVFGSGEGEFSINPIIYVTGIVGGLAGGAFAVVLARGRAAKARDDAKFEAWAATPRGTRNSAQQDRLTADGKPR